MGAYEHEHGHTCIWNVCMAMGGIVGMNIRLHGCMRLGSSRTFSYIGGRAFGRIRVGIHSPQPLGNFTKTLLNSTKK